MVYFSLRKKMDDLWIVYITYISFLIWFKPLIMLQFLKLHANWRVTQFSLFAKANFHPHLALGKCKFWPLHPSLDEWIIGLPDMHKYLRLQEKTCKSLIFRTDGDPGPYMLWSDVLKRDLLQRAPHVPDVKRLCGLCRPKNMWSSLRKLVVHVLYFTLIFLTVLIYFLRLLSFCRRCGISCKGCSSYPVEKVLGRASDEYECPLLIRAGPCQFNKNDAWGMEDFKIDTSATDWTM